MRGYALVSHHVDGFVAELRSVEVRFFGRKLDHVFAAFSLSAGVRK